MHGCADWHKHMLVVYMQKVLSVIGLTPVLCIDRNQIPFACPTWKRLLIWALMNVPTSVTHRDVSVRFKSFPMITRIPA